MPEFFRDVLQFVGFSPEDGEALRALRPHAAGRAAELADRFYARILGVPRAAGVFSGPEQVLRLKRLLADWIGSGLEGPHDEEFCRRRMRIGLAHVRVRLPQEFMFAAMNGLRLDLEDLIEEVYASRPDERRRTARALHRWCDLELAIMLESFREVSDERLRAHERLVTLGRVAGTIGHELRNPLAVLESSVFLLRRRAHDRPDLLPNLERIEQQIARCVRTLNETLALARTDPLETKPLDFAALFAQVEASLPSPAPDLELVVEVPPGVARGDEALIARALVNLITNAAQAGGGSPRPIEVSARPLASGEIEIAVRDHGVGFPDDVLVAPFEPLRSRRSGGIGLGLPLVRQVADRHRGRVELANCPDGGARVRIVLPAP